VSEPQPYADPYLAGVALGIVLLLSFVVAGRGLGASGAFASSAAALASNLAPQQAAGNVYFAHYRSASLWDEWLVVEIIGVLIGGFTSALIAKRVRVEVLHGRRMNVAPRLVAAFGGGSVMGVGAALARGCTSGLALTGGALLSAGAWLFMLAMFASAYAFAPLMRRAWR